MVYIENKFPDIPETLALLSNDRSLGETHHQVSVLLFTTLQQTLEFSYKAFIKNYFELSNCYKEIHAL